MPINKKCPKVVLLIATSAVPNILSLLTAQNVNFKDRKVLRQVQGQVRTEQRFTFISVQITAASAADKINAISIRRYLTEERLFASSNLRKKWL
jgi:hypothetical protein